MFTAQAAGFAGTPKFNVFGDTAILEFGIAHKQWQRREKEEVTVWVKVKVFGKRAERMSTFIRKGTFVAVAGKVTRDFWEKDGVQKHVDIIEADFVDFRNDKGSKPTGTPVQEKDHGAAAEGFGEDRSEDDVPF